MSSKTDLPAEAPAPTSQLDTEMEKAANAWREAEEKLTELTRAYGDARYKYESVSRKLDAALDAEKAAWQTLQQQRGPRP